MSSFVVVVLAVVVIVAAVFIVLVVVFVIVVGLGAVVVYRLRCVELELGYGRLHDYNYCPMCRELGREQSSTIISECPRWLTTAAVQYTTS